MSVESEWMKLIDIMEFENYFRQKLVDVKLIPKFLNRTWVDVRVAEPLLL